MKQEARKLDPSSTPEQLMRDYSLITHCLQDLPTFDQTRNGTPNIQEVDSALKAKFMANDKVVNFSKLKAQCCCAASDRVRKRPAC